MASLIGSARVVFEVEVHTDDKWAPGATLEQIQSRLRSAALDRISRSLPSGAGLIYVGTPKVTAIVLRSSD